MFRWLFRFTNLRQFLGANDTFGGLNSREGIAFESMPTAQHSLDTLQLTERILYPGGHKETIVRVTIFCQSTHSRPLAKFVSNQPEHVAA